MTMADFLQSIVSSRLFLNLLNRSFAAGILVLAVLVLRLLLKKAPKWTHCVLWAFVALRLMLPLGIVSPLSVFGALQSQPNGSMEYFHAGGGSEKPLVEFDTVRIEAPEDPDDTLVQIPNGLAVTRHRASRYLPPLEALWLAGLVGMALYALISLLRLRRRVAASIPMDGGVFACDGIEAPFILGMVKPRIYLPAALCEPQLSHVLAHERAHLARRDHWWKPLGYALLAVHWFNPLLWLGYFVFCRDIELACDERVLRGLDEPARLDYSQSLLDLSRPRAALACPLAFGETGVRERIKAALRYKKPAFWIVLAAVAVCLLASVCFLTNPAYSTTVTPEEEQMLRQMMNEHGYSNLHLHTDVLYNRSGSAWCLLAKNDEMYMIVRRRGFRFSESGGGNPYEGYMDVPKFYQGPLAYWVRGKDARVDRPVGDNQFYDLRREKSAGLVGLAARRVPYPEKAPEELPKPVQGSLLRIQCGGTEFGAFESIKESVEWNEDGTCVTTQGEDAADVIRKNKDVIPGGVDDGSYFGIELPEENAELVEDGLTVYWEATVNPIFNYADINGENWLGEVRYHGPGRYWCCQEVLVRGDYVPAAEENNTTCYNCIFYLDIPAEEEPVPEEYLELFGDLPSVPAKQLRNEPIVVADQKMRLYNKSLLDDFSAKVQQGTPADVMTAFYLAGEEYADKPVFISLQYDGSKIRRIQDFSRAELDGWSYASDVFSYMMEFDTGEGNILLLSDKLFDDYDAYKAVLEAAREEENVEARVALSDYHMAYVLFWKKVMPE